MAAITSNISRKNLADSKSSLPAIAEDSSLDESHNATALVPIERNVYLDERKLLVDLKSKAIQDLDKALVTLSAGAIGLSIAFVKQFSQTPVQSKWLLFSSWILFTTSLTAVLLSLFCSSFLIERMQNNLDEYYQKQIEPIGNPWIKITRWLNLSSLLFFISGVVTLAIFVSKNLS